MEKITRTDAVIEAKIIIRNGVDLEEGETEEEWIETYVNALEEDGAIKED